MKKTELNDLKNMLYDQLLGDRKKKLKDDEAQCPFCSTVYKTTSKEHIISGICDDCWPEEPNV